MESLRKPDALSELLRVLRVRGAVYFVQSFSAPWGMQIPIREHAQFHFVVSGGCEIRTGEFRITAREGEVVLFPQGDAHVVLDGLTEKLPTGREVVEATRAGKPPFQHGRETVQLLSGHFEFDREGRHPLVDSLPKLVHVPLAREVDTAMFTALFPLLQVDSGKDDRGNETIISRLCEIFLVQALRAHFADNDQRPGLLRSLFDPSLRLAMDYLHAHWNEPITVAALARAAGMSRSVFSSRFSHVTATTPMAYLARWRLLQARNLLLSSCLSVAEVAETSGHGSPESFSRSYKQVYGLSPLQTRMSKVAGEKDHVANVRH